MSSRYNILIVDDEADLEMLIRQKFRRQIQAQQYTFYFARNGVEALAQLEAHPELDMVFSDLHMPEMDGLTLLDELALRNPLIRAVIISAFGDMRNIRQAMNRGAFDFIGKPIDFDDFERTLEKTLQFVVHFRTSQQAIQENSLLNSRTQELAKKNQEIELLLKEIHHRVKNNLQTISSLLNLQSATITDPTALKAVQECRERVHSMSLLHQKLYQGEHLTRVEMKDYLQTLAHTLLESFGQVEQGVRLHFPMVATDLDLDTAIPLGLMANELLTNALKYAFPNGRQGNIYVSLEVLSSGEYCLCIADDGVGIPAETADSFAQGIGFGSKLVQLLTLQLGGRIHLETNRGVKTSIVFQP